RRPQAPLFGGHCNHAGAPTAGGGTGVIGYHGAAGADGSGGAEVLVEEPAEAITTLHRAGGDGDQGGRWPGGARVEPLGGAGPVVVVEELGPHALQVPAAEDQGVV